MNVQRAAKVLERLNSRGVAREKGDAGVASGNERLVL